MPRDESRDIWLSVEDLCDAMTSGESDTTIYRHGDHSEPDEVRFSPHSDLVEIERQLADRDAENAELRKLVEQQADAINSALTMLRCGGGREDAQYLLDVINSAIARLETKP